ARPARRRQPRRRRVDRLARRPRGLRGRPPRALPARRDHGPGVGRAMAPGRRPPPPAQRPPARPRHLRLLLHRLDLRSDRADAGRDTADVRDGPAGLRRRLRHGLGKAAAASIAALLDREEADRSPPLGCALDLGCGRGQFTPKLARRGWEAVGVDYVPAAIEAARRREAEGVTYV